MEVELTQDTQGNNLPKCLWTLTWELGELYKRLDVYSWVGRPHVCQQTVPSHCFIALSEKEKSQLLTYFSWHLHLLYVQGLKKYPAHLIYDI